MVAGVEALKEGGAEREDLIREGDAAAPAPAPAPAPAADGVCAAGVVVAAGGGEEEEEAVLEAVGADADDGLPGVEAAVASWDVPLPMPVLLLLPLVHHACVWCLLVALPLPLLLPLLGSYLLDRSICYYSCNQRGRERKKEGDRGTDEWRSAQGRRRRKDSSLGLATPCLALPLPVGLWGGGGGGPDGRTDGRRVPGEGRETDGSLPS